MTCKEQLTEYSIAVMDKARYFGSCALSLFCFMLHCSLPEGGAGAAAGRGGVGGQARPRLLPVSCRQGQRRCCAGGPQAQGDRVSQCSCQHDWDRRVVRCVITAHIWSPCQVKRQGSWVRRCAWQAGCWLLAAHAVARSVLKRLANEQGLSAAHALTVSSV